MFNTLVLYITGLVVGTYIALAIILHKRHEKYRHIPGPPRSSFWLGHLQDLAKSIEQFGFFSNWCLHLSLEHGETFVLWFHFRPCVITVNQQCIKELLVTGDYKKDKRSYSLISRLFGQRCFGRGLLTEVNHEVWAKKRQILNPAFSKRYLKGMVDIFNERADALVKSLEQHADTGQVLSMLDKFHLTTLDIIAKAAFNIDMHSVEEEKNPLKCAIFQALVGISMQLKHPIKRINPFKERSFKEECRKACRFVRSFGKDLLHQRISALNRGEDVPTDIMTFCALAHSQHERDVVSEEAIVDDFFTFFIAGQETTANVCGFALLAILQNPGVYQRILDEIKVVLGEKEDLPYEKISELEYLNCVVKETLRLYPPISVTFRRLHKEHNIGCYQIPSGTNVIMSTYVSGRYPKFHRHPESFDPDRFSLNSTNRPSIYSFFPFSIGPRSCIGQMFGLCEAKVILVKLLRSYDLTLDPSQTFDMQANMTLKPSGGVMCSISRKG